MSTSTPFTVAINRLESEAGFEETLEQLSPRRFKNTGVTIIFYVQCSYWQL